MFRHKFDLGNSNEGPVGVCAYVWAESRQEALDILRAELPDDNMVVNNGCEPPNVPDVEYIQTYFNTEKITLDDITEIEDEDGNDVDDAVASAAT